MFKIKKIFFTLLLSFITIYACDKSSFTATINNDIDCNNITALDSNWSIIQTVNGSINLENGNTITNLNQLNNLNIVTQKLNLNNQALNDITGLSQLKTVSYLNLSDNDLINLNGLQNIQNINVLNLQNNNLNDISDICHLNINHLLIIDDSSSITTKCDISSNLCQGNQFWTNDLTTLSKVSISEYQNFCDDINKSTNDDCTNGLGKIHIGDTSCSNKEILNLEKLEKMEGILTLSDIYNISSLSNLNEIYKLILTGNIYIKNFNYLNQLNSINYLYIEPDIYYLINNIEGLSNIKCNNDTSCTIKIPKKNYHKKLKSSSEICLNNNSTFGGNLWYIEDSNGNQYTKHDLKYICENFNNDLNITQNCPIVNDNTCSNGFQVDNEGFLESSDTINCSSSTNNTDLLNYTCLQQVENLDLSYNSLSSLSGLDNLKNVFNFNLSNNNTLTNLSNLSDIKNILNLNLSYNTGLSNFIGLENIEYINITFDNSNISSFQGLNNIKNISLDIDSTSLSNIQTIQHIQTIDQNLKIVSSILNDLSFINHFQCFENGSHKQKCNFIFDDHNLSAKLNNSSEICLDNDLLWNNSDIITMSQICDYSTFYDNSCDKGYGGFHNGNIYCMDNNYTHINQFSFLNEINGTLKLNDNNLTNLYGLRNLKSINGDVYLYNNSNLEDISDLKSLKCTGSSCHIKLDNRFYKKRLPKFSEICSDNNNSGGSKWTIYDKTITEFPIQDIKNICDISSENNCNSGFNYYDTSISFTLYNNAILCKSASLTDQQMIFWNDFIGLEGGYSLDLSDNNFTHVDFLDNTIYNNAVIDLSLNDSLYNIKGLNTIKCIGGDCELWIDSKNYEKLDYNSEICQDALQNINNITTDGWTIFNSDDNISNGNIILDICLMNKIVDTLEFENFNINETDLTEFSHIEDAEIINLSHNNINNIDFFNSLQSIDTLYLTDTNISHVNGLSNLTNLSNEIDLSLNINLTDLIGLNNVTCSDSSCTLYLPNHIYTNEINGSSEICQNNVNTGNTKWEIFSVENNAVINNLNSAILLKICSEIPTNLPNLYLNQLNLINSDLTKLNNITNVNFIDLSENNLTNVDFLSNLDNIDTLNLSYNNITNLNGLSNLTTINNNIDLKSNNTLTDITGLNNVTCGTSQCILNISDVTLSNKLDENSEICTNNQYNGNDLWIINIFDATNTVNNDNFNIENLCSGFYLPQKISLSGEIGTMITDTITLTNESNTSYDILVYDTYYDDIYISTNNCVNDINGTKTSILIPASSSCNFTLNTDLDNNIKYGNNFHNMLKIKKDNQMYYIPIEVSLSIPYLISDYPVINTLNENNISLTFQFDTAGTLYYNLVDDNTTLISQSEVNSGMSSIGSNYGNINIIASTNYDINFNNLTEDSFYKLYLYFQDSNATEWTNIAYLDFYTPHKIQESINITNNTYLLMSQPIYHILQENELNHFIKENDITKLWKFNNNEWITNHMYDTYNTYQRFTTISPNEAFWIKSNHSNINWRYSDVEWNDTTYQNYIPLLQNEWNLIGVNRDTNVTDFIDNIETQNSDNNVKIISMWQYTNNTWKYYNVNNEYNNIETITNISKYDGIWVKIDMNLYQDSDILQNVTGSCTSGFKDTINTNIDCSTHSLTTENLNNYIGLKYIYGYLNLSNNDLNNLDGLSSLEFIENYIDITNNTNLIDLEGLNDLTCHTSNCTLKLDVINYDVKLKSSSEICNQNITIGTGSIWDIQTSSAAWTIAEIENYLCSQ